MITRQIKHLCLVFVFFYITYSSLAQETRFSSGFFAGDVCSATPQISIWAFQENPARLAFLKCSEIGIAHTTNFTTANMLCTRINACTQMRHNTIASSIITYGNMLYRESYIQLCLAREIYDNHSISIKLNMANCHQKDHKSIYSLIPEIAFAGSFDKFSYGIQTTNPIGICKQSKYIESRYKISGSYFVTEDILVSLGICISDYDNTIFAISVGHTIIKWLEWNLTYQTSKNPFVLGLSIPLRGISLQYETIVNYYLGLSHTIGLRIIFNKNSDEKT